MNAPLPLTAVEDRGVLRFITAGSVDDGKSTLIGRLLYDTKSILVDQLDALARGGQRRAAEGDIDLSSLTDGLEAEREQGITIDVAYRYFATARRKFIIADTPGHEQYTRNMVTGATTADAAVILIDATRVLDGALLPQTRRHTALVSLIGVRHVLVAVNKMDAVDYAQQRFDEIVAAHAALATRLGIEDFAAVPISALRGDNIVQRSSRMPWYDGPSVLDWLLEAPSSFDDDAALHAPLRLPVQRVRKAELRANASARAYTGRVAAGRVHVGQTIRVLPAGTAARVAAIETYDGDLNDATTGQSIGLRLDREIDVSRGDVIVSDDAAQAPVLAHRIQVDLAWLDNVPLNLQRKVWIRHGTRLVLGRVRSIDSVLDLELGQWHARENASLSANDIGRVEIETQQPLAFDPYHRSKTGGAFALIDATTHQTIAAGMIRGAVQ